jgi:protein phosphatase
VACEPGDIFLLCTDGVTDGLYDSALLDLLRPAPTTSADENPARTVVQMSVQNSGRDNATALVIEVGV